MVCEISIVRRVRIFYSRACESHRDEWRRPGVRAAPLTVAGLEAQGRDRFVVLPTGDLPARDVDARCLIGRFALTPRRGGRGISPLFLRRSVQYSQARAIGRGCS